MYYGSYGMYNGFYSASYLLVIIGAVLCLLASARVKSTYRKYAKVRSASGLTGAQAAEMILRRIISAARAPGRPLALLTFG